MLATLRSCKLCNLSEGETVMLPHIDVCLDCKSEIGRPDGLNRVSYNHVHLALRPVRAQGTAEKIMERACALWNLAPEVLRGRTRIRPHSSCRAWLYFAVVQIMHATMVEAGALIGKDHSSVCHALSLLRARHAACSELKAHDEEQVRLLHKELSDDKAV